MNSFKILLSIWLFIFCCFQTRAQEKIAPVSVAANLGITTIVIEPSGDNSRTVRLKANQVYVNEQKLDLDGSVYEMSKNEKSIELLQRFSDGETQSLQFDGETVVFSNSGTVTIINDETIASLSPAEWNSVIVLANVLKEADVHFDDTDVNFESPLKASIKYRQCDHVEISGGASRSVTEKRCEDNTVKFLKTHTDCVKYGSCDVTCVWGDHLCFATAFFLCNGSTCFFN
jgi:hypothetical protein